MRNKNIKNSRDKKLKLISGLFQFFFKEATKPFNDLKYTEEYIKKGDYVIEASCIHGDRGYSGIGKVIKVGKCADGWQIMCLDGKKRNWNNAWFIRMPEEVQELFSPDILSS